MRLSKDSRVGPTRAGGNDDGQLAPTSVANIHAVAKLELEALRPRSAIDRLTERVTRAASSSLFTAVHVLWFAAWIAMSTVGPWRFDPYPFNFLTLVVSLEAIVLTGFVLRDQARMAQINDQRAHLDLQVNLLAEEELTMILSVVCGLAGHVGYDPHADNPKLKELLAHTNVKALADQIERELASEAPAQKRRG